MPISIMIKPSSSACNLKCEYCFYSSVAENRQQGFKGFMSEKTVINILKYAFEFTKGDDVYFVFQGGEPLLAGIKYFQFFLENAKTMNAYNSKVSISVQTNGTLINDEWCKLFSENGILVGVSLDGDEELNSYRKYQNGEESFYDVVRGINLLKQYNVQFNILSVLTKRLSKNIRKSYKFFKESDVHYLQYIPCLKPFDAEDNEYSMTSNDYSTFLKSGFKLYFNDNMRGNLMSIRQFDNFILLASGKPAEQCGMNGPCSNQFVVEGDGSVYPCDFYCVDEWLLGNINENSFEELYHSPKAVEFIKESFNIKDECKNCNYFQVCRSGGCKRNKAGYEYCDAYKDFFDNCLDLILKMR